jgi:hypothetical protein
MHREDSSSIPQHFHMPMVLQVYLIGSVKALTGP